MGVQYEVYVDGVLSGEQIHFWRDAGTPKFEVTSGGVLHADAPYSYMTCPNVIPAWKTGGVLGLTPELDDLGNVAYAFGWAGAYVATDGAKVRYFLQKYTLKQQWSDGTALVGRWTGLGAQENDFSNLSPSWAGHVRQQRVSFGQDYYDSDFFNPSGTPPQNPETPYQLTDGSGIATYYGLLGIAIGIPDDGPSPFYTWTLIQLGLALDLTPLQNLAMFVNQAELHPYANTGAGTPYPVHVNEAHAERQWVPGTTTPDTSGWSVDYATQWDATSGMLAYGTPPLVTHTYYQWAQIDVMEADGTPIPATVAFGPYSGPAGTMIDCVPKGSLLKDVRFQAEDRPDAQPGEPGYIGPLDELPLQDASGYPTSSVEGELPHLVPPNLVEDGSLLSSAGPGCGYALRYPVRHTGKAGNTLTGVETVRTGTNWPDPGRGLFDGGEVLSRHYDVTATCTDGSGRTLSGKVVVHEDCLVIYPLVFDPPATGAGGLDYCLDPHGDPWLTEAKQNQDGVWQHEGQEMERIHGFRRILSTKMLSPSRQVCADHEHLLAGIENTQAKLWRSEDGENWTLVGTIDGANTYKGICLRLGPDECLHAWMTTDGGAVKHRASRDGGATWDALDDVATLPACRAERIDVRHDGREWLALCGLPGGALELYGSPDGETWSHELQVSAAGRSPWLLVLSEGCYLAVYHTGTELRSRRFGEYGGAWSLGPEVTLLSGENRGHAGFNNSQKTVIAYVDTNSEIRWKKSHTSGDTWEDGSEG